MQYQLEKDNFSEVQLLLNQMNAYFPHHILPIDPWLGFEIIDKIHKPLNAIDSQKEMITHLVQSNSEINVKLIGIIRSIELGHFELTNTLINDYILSK